ncbi:MAG: hypothetical protein JXB45_11540 [Candidatus Krumholzibacteriota bacterium]|nr:hypothetical protein [Candidatus Krumholzibacteriota bacterium]
MFTGSYIRYFGLSVLFLALLPLGGCKEYEVRVKINPDGSGTRHITLTTEPDEGEKYPEALPEFRNLYGLKESKGWKISADKMVISDEKGKEGEKKTFLLETRAKKLTDWQLMGGDIHIKGALDNKKFEGVEVVNRIEVEFSDLPGSRTCTYREQIIWSELREVLIEFVAARFCEELAREYPSLGSEERMEMRGLMKGVLAVSLEDLIESDNESAEIKLIAASLTPLAARVLERKKPDLDASRIAPITEHVLQDPDNRIDQFIEKNLPGVHLSGLTIIRLRVEMPGPIIESNADETEANTASWEFSTTDAIAKPFELFVKSEVKE